MSARKRYLAAITARVINGLPAPLEVDLSWGGSTDVGLKLDSIADARQWLALDPTAYLRDSVYEANDNHPRGYRILSGAMSFMGVTMHIRAVDDLPGPASEDAETVLAFVAADGITPSPPEEVAGSVAAGPATAGPATAPDFELGPVEREPLTDEQIDGAVVALAEALDANPELLDDETPFHTAMRAEGVVPDFDEPDACPKGDPDCETGDDGSSHDGCTPARDGA